MERKSIKHIPIEDELIAYTRGSGLPIDEFSFAYWAEERALVRGMTPTVSITVYVMAREAARQFNLKMGKLL